jgi:hypothetical protein
VVVDRSNVTESREDISRFVAHITKDTEQPARENLRSIWQSRIIEARDLHCLHKHKLKDLPEAQRKQFYVGCYTEVPLHQIHLLIQPVAGRDVVFQPYGIVFRKRFLIEKGAQPAIYINSYGANHFHIDAADVLYNWCKTLNFMGFGQRLLPLLNAMHEQYDFAWEREWRVVGHLSFEIDDIVCLILPPEGEDDLKAMAAHHGVAVISPGWTYERIVAEVAMQQRAASKRFHREVAKLSAEAEGIDYKRTQ